MTNPLRVFLLLTALAVATPAEAQTFVARRTSVRVAARPRLARAPMVRADAWRTTGLTTSVAPTPQPPTLAPARPGLVQCHVTAAGVLAPATVEVRDHGRVIASGTCGERLSVAAGSYDATITLERAIDRPQQNVRLIVPEGGVATASAAFDTSIIEVRFLKSGASTFGQAILERDGRTLGSIGSGVVAHVSSGRLTIRARYLTEWKTYTVDLSNGQRRAVIASF